MKQSNPFISKLLIRTGNFSVVLGSVALLFGLMNLIDFDSFSFGLSSGIRIIGSVSIAGCLLSAIGYGMQDFCNSND